MNGCIVEELGTNWKSRLFELLDRQQAVCTDLSDRCEKQAVVLTADRVSDLLTVLGERQELIDELSELSLAMEPYREAWPELLRHLSDDEQKQVRQHVESVQQMVNEVMTRDTLHQRTLRREQSRIRKEMDSVNVGRQSNKAYGRPIHRGIEPITNRFADERG